MMKRNIFYFALVLLIAFSCKKAETTIDPGISQLWIKVSNSIPDFEISFNSQLLKSKANNCLVSYVNKIFTPNLKSFEITDNGNTSTWVMVHKSSDQTDEITFKFSDKLVLKTRGFKKGEKRFIEVIQTVNGTFSTVDHDITMNNKIIWVD